MIALLRLNLQKRAFYAHNGEYKQPIDTVESHINAFFGQFIAVYDGGFCKYEKINMFACKFGFNIDMLCD